jgi:hypothetical protein
MRTWELEAGFGALVAVHFMVPELSAKPMGIVPMLRLASGRQSWLVGYCGRPWDVLAGVQLIPLSRPPWQVPLFGDPTLPPVQSGQVWMPGVNGRLSPIRKISELSGRLTAAVPAAQSSVPEAADATVLITQVLVGVLAVFGIGSGPPKKQPGLLQKRSLPVSVDVLPPSVAVCPTQLVILVMEFELFGVMAGSGTELPPPPK